MVTLRNKITRWTLECEHTSVSSIQMAAIFSGYALPQRFPDTNPIDIGDFHACLTLVAWVPECRPRLQELKSLGPKWAALVDNWELIEQRYIDTYGHTMDRPVVFNADKTFAILKSLEL